MTEKIVVEEEPAEKLGTQVAIALVGPWGDLFEIRRVEANSATGRTDYFVNEVRVPRETYLDALETARADCYDPDGDDYEPVGDRSDAAAENSSGPQGSAGGRPGF